MKIKIRDYEYNIYEVDRNEENFVHEDGSLRLYGETDYTKQTIKILKELNYTRKRQTLIHELVHAFHDVYLASAHVKDKYDEEDICCFFATYGDEILKIVENYFKNKKQV